MTRYGIVCQQYNEIERRPFSRFAQQDDEVRANKEWIDRAMQWGLQHVDEFGHKIETV